MRSEPRKSKQESGNGNWKLKSGVEQVTLTRARPETENQNLGIEKRAALVRTGIETRNQKAKTGIRAGARQSQESPIITSNYAKVRSESGMSRSELISNQKPRTRNRKLRSARSKSKPESETGNQKTESRLEPSNRTRGKRATGNRKLRSERCRSKTESESRISRWKPITRKTNLPTINKYISQAGAGQSHESPARNRKLKVERRAEQVQTRI